MGDARCVANWKSGGVLGSEIRYAGHRIFGGSHFGELLCQKMLKFRNRVQYLPDDCDLVVLLLILQATKYSNTKLAFSKSPSSSFNSKKISILPLKAKILRSTCSRIAKNK
jgi:hypothetical protein